MLLQVTDKQGELSVRHKHWWKYEYNEGEVLLVITYEVNLV